MSCKERGAIALSYRSPRVRVRARVKLSAAFFQDESSITIGGYESAIAPRKIYNVCMNDDMQRKIITYVHMNCVLLYFELLDHVS